MTHCWTDFNTTRIQGLNVLVLFNGLGFAARGLLDSGIAGAVTCVEIDPARNYLSEMLNPEATHITADVMDLSLDWIHDFDAVWASPPCQKRSGFNATVRDVDTMPVYNRHDTLLQWCLDLENPILWVENVIDWVNGNNEWGQMYNAAQFAPRPRQIRQRLIGGRYRPPRVFRPFKRTYRYDGLHICPAIVGENNRLTPRQTPSGYNPNPAVEFVGRPLSVREAAWFQGLDNFPDSLLSSWYHLPPGNQFGRRFDTWPKWRYFLYRGIGDAVPVWMSKAFGEAYSKGLIEHTAARQMQLL